MSFEGEPNRAIREYIQNGGAREWQHKDVAQSLYEWADVFRFYFFGAQTEHQQGLPQPLVAVAPLRVDTLAGYRIVPNPNGLPYEITLNSHYLKRPQWEALETLLHEMVHVFQENTPAMEKCKNNYHNQQFVEICEEIGLHPRQGSGAHWKPADGQFAMLMKRNGVEARDYGVIVPPEAKKKFWWDEDRGGKKGSSTLLKYVCGCPPPKNSLRTGRKDLEAMCLVCGTVFKSGRQG